MTTISPLRSLSDPAADTLADHPVVLHNEQGEGIMRDREDERTSRTRIAEAVQSADDGVPVHRGRAHPERGREPAREDSGMLARAVLDRADAYVRRQFGAGLSDDAKALAVEVARETIDAWVHQREDVTTSRHRVPSSLSPQPAPRTGLVVSIVTAVGLVAAILVGSVLALRITDRLAALDAVGRERMTIMETRLAEAESRSLELRKDYEARMKTAETAETDHAQRIAQLEARQNAMTIYMMESLRRLLKAQGIPEPPVPPILRIAEAEAENALQSTK